MNWMGCLCLHIYIVSYYVGIVGTFKLIGNLGIVHLSQKRQKGEKNLNLSYNNFYLKFSQTILNICEISFY